MRTFGDEYLAPFCESSTHLIAGDLKLKAMKGSMWTILGYGGSQGLRLVSNLILTRILFPEDFGVMALVTVVLQGITLFSDIGIGPSIIQSSRGNDVHFLNTAWTIQVARGFILFLVTCALAWPLASFYNQAVLAPLLSVSGLTAIISGFNPTKLWTANRELSLGRITLVDFVSQGLGLAILIPLAWWTQSIWALVIGGLITALLKLAFAHWFVEGNGNKFHWEKSSVIDLFSFGRWIFIGTVASYLGGQGLRLFQGALVPISTLGLVSIASLLAWSMGQLTGALSSRVMFPVLSQVSRETPELFRTRFLSYKLRLVVLTQPVFFTLIIFGSDIINMLYDERYKDSGIYLSLLAWGGSMNALRMLYSSAFLSLGRSRDHMLIQVTGAVVRPLAIWFGYDMGEEVGMLLALSLSGLFIYPLEIFLSVRQGIYTPMLDVIVLGTGIIVASIVFNISIINFI